MMPQARTLAEMRNPPRKSRNVPPTKRADMFRFLKFLPVLIPVAQKILRNKTVREKLNLKPLATETAGRRRR